MDYLQALENAIVYIEDHLHEEITVERVARAAGYSYYHLTRQFAALLGESVGGYIKKRRLANAAQTLVYTNTPVTTIALESGFSSCEAFSRAFKTAYHTSPSQYRKNRLLVLVSGNKRLEPKLLKHRARNVTVQPQIVQMPPVLVAGLRGYTTLQHNVVPALWARFMAVAYQIPNRLPGARGFGICEACTKNNLYTMNDRVRFTEVAAVEVSSVQNLPAPFVHKKLPGGHYAVFTHTGSLDMIAETFAYIWGTWFLNTKYTLDAREDFELYDERFLGRNNPQSQVDIYIPIQP